MTDMPSTRRAGEFSAEGILSLGSWACFAALDSTFRGPECGFEVLTSLLGEGDNLDYKSFSSFCFHSLLYSVFLEVWNENSFNKISEDIRVQI